MAAIPVYPPVLTDANWQTQKGIIAKVVKGETGIGAELIKLKTRYDTLAQAWSHFNPMARNDIMTMSLHDVVNLKQLAHNETVKITAVTQQAGHLRTMLVDLGGKWTRSLVVPKATATHVGTTMVGALDTLVHTLGAVNVDNEYHVLEGNVQQRVTIEQNQLKVLMKAVNVGLKAMIGKSAPKDFETHLKQPVRGVGAWIGKANSPYNDLYHADWEPYIGDTNVAKLDNPTKVGTAVLNIASALQDLRVRTGLSNSDIN